MREERQIYYGDGTLYPSRDRFLESLRKTERALLRARTFCVEGASLGEIFEELLAGVGTPSFPPCVSVGDVLAHGYPLPGFPRYLQRGELVRLDAGSIVNQHLSDMAFTFEVETNNEHRFIEAGKEALTAALKESFGTFEEITEAITNRINSYGFFPVSGLSGHEILPGKIHGNLRIFNCSSDLAQQEYSKDLLPSGTVFSTEPLYSRFPGRFFLGEPVSIYTSVFLNHYDNSETANPLYSIANRFRDYHFLPFYVINKADPSMGLDEILHHLSDVPKCQEYEYKYGTNEEANLLAHFETNFTVSNEESFCFYPEFIL